MAQFFTVLYWIATIGISAVLIVTTVMICALGFKFMKNSRKVLGASCIAFSLLAASMLALMINRTFILPGL